MGYSAFLYCLSESNVAIYMKFGNFKGQVSTAGFQDWIELSSFQFGVGRRVASGAGGAVREGSNPHISEIAITKRFDVASSKLYQEAVAGTFDTKVEIKLTTTTKNKVDTYLAIELTDCGVTNYVTESRGGSPEESLSLAFTKIMYTPSPLDVHGSPKKGAIISYDLLKMTAS